MCCSGVLETQRCQDVNDLFKVVYSMPATQVELEIFSYAAGILTNGRINLLGPEALEDIVYIHQNITCSMIENLRLHPTEVK